MAIERTILTAVWNMLAGGTLYSDLGGDCYTKRAPMRAKNNAIHQLESLGYQVNVQPAPARPHQNSCNSAQVGQLGDGFVRAPEIVRQRIWGTGRDRIVEQVGSSPRAAQSRTGGRH